MLKPRMKMAESKVREPVKIGRNMRVQQDGWMDGSIDR